MNKFEKVSFNQFKDGYSKCFPEAEYDEKYLKETYDNIKIPKRATIDSAGYDFYSPIDFKLNSGTSIMIPTGIRVQINKGWFLGCFPRSSLGFKYRLQLDNCVGIVDDGYYYSDNEGHIFAKITNDSKVEKTVRINSGDRFMQGIFIPFGITDDDNATNIRNGGLGSTNK